MFTILMVITALAAAALLGVLVLNLLKIIELLGKIGGYPDSFLAKLRLGLRAIETETGHLGPNVVSLNEELQKIAAGLTAVDEHLQKTIQAVLQQERS